MHEKARGRKVAWVAGLVAVAVIAVATWWAWPHIVFRWRFEPLGKNEQGYFEYKHRQTGIVMVRLPGGTFWMGAQKEDPSGRNADREAEDNEGPVHAVTLSPFLIAKFELTQAEWKRVMGSNPAAFKGDELPVENVSWDDCQAFCQKARLKLPTEAQWEYSCRAGTTGPYAGTGHLDDMGWYVDNSNGKAYPVGQKAPNDFGLYDMHGNVWELCEDVVDPDFYQRPEASGNNPVCTAGSLLRVGRGGGVGVLAYATNFRSTNRGGFRQGSSGDALGFRTAYYPLP